MSGELRNRVTAGLQQRDNWKQLTRFALVGISGYGVNLLTFAFCIHALGTAYQLASVVAFLTSVTNNFVLNRHWTFDAGDGHAGHQAARFLVLSTATYLLSFALLSLLVEVVGLPEVPSQAIAVVAAMPINFAGNRFWSFRQR